MLPQDSLMNRNSNSSPSGPSQLYSSISSQGMAKPESNSEQPTSPQESQNPAEKVIAEFGQTFNQVQSLLENPDYQGASKEADLVKKALQNWVETIVGQLSQPAQVSQGGELSQNQL